MAQSGLAVEMSVCRLMMLWTAPHSTASMCQRVVALEANHYEGEPSMGEVSTIGLDIAKSVFQVHGVDVDGTVVIRKRVSRAGTGVIFDFSVLPCWHRSLPKCPSLEPRASGARPYGAADATQLCEGLSQAQ